MSATTFEQCLSFVLTWEGGYVDNPNDYGGSTNYGVTQATYDAYRTQHSLAAQSVQLISSAEVAAVYQSMYWETSYAYMFAYPLALTIFDSQVQFNPVTARGFILQALGAPINISLPVLLAEMASSSPVKLATAIISQRQAFRLRRVAEDPTQQIFLKGWQNRDAALLAAISETN